MPGKRSRIFSREFKLEVVSRMVAGGNVSALARQSGVRRKLLYEWRDAWSAGGEAALRSPGRPRKGTSVVGARDRSKAPSASAGGGGAAAVARPPGGPPDELAAARRRIAELERKVGQQTLEADFFRQALRQVETLRQPDNRHGGAASMASSRHGRSGKAD